MIQTLKDIGEIKGKRVLLRVDFNVPIDKTGVTDDTRIRETLPTIQYLLREGARLVVITHLGRPEGKVVDGLKLTAVADRLEHLLQQPVSKLDGCVGPEVEKAVRSMEDGSITLLENIRFYPQEEANDPDFAAQLARLGELYVNDAFAACHRAHASVAGLPQLLTSYAGFLLAEEVEHLTPLLSQVDKPLTVIVGGAKIDTKISLIKNYVGIADTIIIGGALANTFLAAQGYDVGASLYEADQLSVARETLLLAEQKGTAIALPHDVIVADTVTEYTTTLDLPLEDIEGAMKILDAGKETMARYAKIVNESATIIWNGPIGLYEFTPFSHGTKILGEAIALRKNEAKTYVGGGDTLDALSRLGIDRDRFTFVSTGGGAMLEFLEGKKLPGILALEK
ncbi:phosphoglycerate kinase [Candidatus Peregrinibacteria bacterium CG_4_9_14_0_2_um_filter_53_11]|nr:MAG: phosphoglycerate kinase [Candidatus Peregrinibacteria bacterium CG_4_9_14_0_2_um_filter_53_11]